MGGDIEIGEAMRNKEKMNDKTPKDDFDPSLHIVPLDLQTRTPIVMAGKDIEDNTLVAITDNGRISFFPVEAETVFLNGERIGRTFPLVQDISKRIDEQFPNNKDREGNLVKQYLAVCVMYGSKERGWYKFIYKVWGFLDYSRELDVLYSKLYSIQGLKVGSKEYKDIENYLYSEPVRSWVNRLIAALKEKLDWSNYVRGELDNV